MPKKLQDIDPWNLSRPSGFWLLIITIFWLFWSITLKPLGLLKSWCYFWVPWTINFEMYNFPKKSVDNFDGTKHATFFKFINNYGVLSKIYNRNDKRQISKIYSFVHLITILDLRLYKVCTNLNFSNLWWNFVLLSG